MYGLERKGLIQISFQFLLGCFGLITAPLGSVIIYLSIPSRMLPMGDMIFDFARHIDFQFLLGCFRHLSREVTPVGGYFQFLLGCFQIPELPPCPQCGASLSIPSRMLLFTTAFSIFENKLSIPSRMLPWYLPVVVEVVEVVFQFLLGCFIVIVPWHGHPVFPSFNSF